MQTETKFDLKKQFKEETKLEFSVRMKKLSIGHKIYLWMRRNWVQDLLFKNSTEHLTEIVKQYYQGRTSVRSRLEIGIMIEVQDEWLTEKLVEF